MKLDSEDQRKVLLAAINGSNWPGQLIDVIFEVKNAVIFAEIETNANLEVQA